MGQEERPSRSERVAFGGRQLKCVIQPPRGHDAAEVAGDRGLLPGERHAIRDAQIGEVRPGAIGDPKLQRIVLKASPHGEGVEVGIHVHVAVVVRVRLVRHEAHLCRQALVAVMVEAEPAPALRALRHAHLSALAAGPDHVLRTCATYLEGQRRRVVHVEQRRPRQRAAEGLASALRLGERTLQELEAVGGVLVLVAVPVVRVTAEQIEVLAEGRPLVGRVVPGVHRVADIRVLLPEPLVRQRTLEVGANRPAVRGHDRAQDYVRPHVVVVPAVGDVVEAGALEGASDVGLHGVALDAIAEVAVAEGVGVEVDVRARLAVRADASDGLELGASAEVAEHGVADAVAADAAAAVHELGHHLRRHAAVGLVEVERPFVAALKQHLV